METAILRNVQTNDLYRHNENDNYTNTRTGISGSVSPEKAQKVFLINLEATEIFNQYPNCEKLILALGLSFTK